MSIEQGLFTALSADPALAALNGARVYPDFRPQTDKAQTAIVYFQISSVHGYSVPLDAQIVRSLYQIDAWARTKTTALQLSAAIVAAINKATGQLGGQPVELVTLESEISDYDDDTDTYRQILNFNIYHHE